MLICLPGLPRQIGIVVSGRLDGGVWDVTDALEKAKVIMDAIQSKDFSGEAAGAEESLRSL